MEHRVIIKRHRPYLRWLIVGSVSGVLLIAAWALYTYTRSTTVSDFEQARAERATFLRDRQRLAAQLRKAEREVLSLKEQLVYAKRSQEIDKAACETVRASLGGLQASVSELQEQVAFYRGIVSPEESRAGVRVYEFRITPSAVAGVYRYELVLIQSVRHDRTVKGKVDLRLSGMQDGAMTELPLGSLSLEPVDSLLFSFKYFQEFSGELRLPDGFRPVRVQLAVDPSGKRQPSIETEYDWPQILGS